MMIRKKFIARKDCPNKIMSDNETVFKSQDNQLFYSERGFMGKFNSDCAPWRVRFWERLVGMVKKSLKKSIGSERLSFMELSTVLSEIENVLNNRPLCFMYDDDMSEVLTPNSLMYGRKLEFENKCVDEGYFEVIERNELWLRKCAVQKVAASSWLMWHREYLDGLREKRG